MSKKPAPTLTKNPAPAAPTLRAPWYEVALGLALGLALLKFGNPPIMEKYVTAPTNIYEFVFGFPWPIGWAYAGLIGLAVLGFIVRTAQGIPRTWIFWLPAAWWLWSAIASTQTLSAAHSIPTLKHLAACAGFFYLACLFAPRENLPTRFWLAVIIPFLLALAVGWDQHFGGLEQSRKFAELYILPTMKEVPPEYLKKLSSTRIFGTLFYPNTFAGAVILFLPASLAVIWEARERFTPGARIFLLVLVGALALAGLVWSGSKGGWLILLALGVAALVRTTLPQRVRWGIIALVLALGLTTFFVRYSAFFARGATSVGARFDYWESAGKITLQHPFFGTGPGTFALPYESMKRPDAEMTRLVHNDYLQQASDAGLPAALFYLAFIAGALILSFPGARADLIPGAVWLGVLGWSLQSLMEFCLYIPALAWPAFFLLGWLLVRRQKLHQPPAPATTSGGGTDERNR